ncbi:MAG: PSD1 and planctomycete cytochrome C domain-containing protein [Bryobacterales bacterium]|nr:PSD1 and planctomycete cytochrome C domain-containing protein [Bryobacterales bacterium]
MDKSFRIGPAGLILALLTGVVTASGADTESLDYFERYVRPLLAEQCYACHSRASPVLQAELRVDSRASLLKGGKSGPAIEPGNPDGSRLLQVLHSDEGVRMPPTGKLDETQIERIATWISMGAPFPEAAAEGSAIDAASTHWAFVPPRTSDPPVSATGWAETPIDRFVEARLVEAGLHASAEADPRTLIRRVFFDLTGLPPTAEEADAFASSPTPEAYEAVVESLLASERFGERWARHWLDVVRYSDEGFQARPFAIAWPYRDWVVDAFNNDLPYDEFVRYQLAADLDASDKRHLAAMGMLTLGINLPRPTDVPENLDDRIDVVSRGFLGLSVACARCHDHKFDQISQQDYYSLYSVFLNSPNVVEPVPLEAFGSDHQTEFFREKLAERRKWLDTYREERLQDHVREFRQPEELARYLEAAWSSRAQGNREVEVLSKEKDLNLYVLKRWRDYLNGLVGPSVQAFAALDTSSGAAELAQRIVDADSDYRWPDPEREALRLALRGNGSPTDIPVEDFWWVQNEGDSNVMKALKWQYDAVMRDWSHRGGPRHAMVTNDARVPQPTYLFVRGNQHDKGAEVKPKFLSALSGPPEFRSGSGRLELARLIGSTENPLTARVFVNRVWGHLFGEGLVRTPSDFGRRGDPPSHPKLLDYLATEFAEDGWSTKNLIRRIVLSKAYRQSSDSRPEGVAEDPSNRLLWRQNRTRLSFEALRDTMLSVAGNLDTTLGGAPFELSAQPASPRRTIYAYVSREEPSALMRAFDFSNPEEHTPRRQLTTVPQQALFLMNSSFLADQARTVAAACGGPEQCVDVLHRRILGRSPTDQERQDGLAFLVDSDQAQAESRHQEPGKPAWLHGTAQLDLAAGAIKRFKRMEHLVGERVQPAPMYPEPETGRASLTPTGGHPGDDLDSVAVRRWTAPRTFDATIEGTLSHALGSQGRRFNYSNGIRGWLVSSERGVLASWVVRGFEVETVIKALDVVEGEHIDFVVDSLGDYESDSFLWSPRIEEVLAAEQRESGMEPQSWSAEEGFPRRHELPLTATERYAQVLMMTNEFAFRD